MIKDFFEAIQKRGIYKSVVINETSTTVNSLEPARDYDVMYYTEPGIGSGQMFYASSKHGKQVFAYDRSGITGKDKVRAFVEAAQTLAVRE